MLKEIRYKKDMLFLSIQLFPHISFEFLGEDVFCCAQQQDCEQESGNFIAFSLAILADIAGELADFLFLLLKPG